MNFKIIFTPGYRNHKHYHHYHDTPYFTILPPLHIFGPISLELNSSSPLWISYFMSLYSKKKKKFEGKNTIAPFSLEFKWFYLIKYQKKKKKSPKTLFLGSVTLKKKHTHCIILEMIFVENISHLCYHIIMLLILTLSGGMAVIFTG